MPRLPYLLLLVWPWWLPSTAAGSTLAIEHSGVAGGVSLSDAAGEAIALRSVAITAVIDGPWATTKVDLEYRDHGLPVTLEVALASHSRPLDLLFAPAPKPGGGNKWMMQVVGHGRRASFTYVQEVAQSRVVLLPLTGHREIERLFVRVTNQSGQPLTEPLAVQGDAADGDVVLRRVPSEEAIRSRDLVAVPLRLTGTTEPEPLADVLFLVDTSASAYRSLEQLGELLRTLVARSRGQLGLVAFDQEVETLYLGSAAGVDAQVLARVRERGAVGATDMEGMLGSVSGIVRQGPFRRVVLVGDGMDTVGSHGISTLKRLVAGWKGLGIHRFDVVTVTSVRDDSRLTELTTAGLGEHGVVVAADNSLADLSRLERRTIPERAVTVIGATAQSPRILRGRQAGDLVWIHARVPTGLPVTVQVATLPPRSWTTTDAYYPLLARVFPHNGIAVPHKPSVGVLGEQVEIREGKVEAIEIRTRPPIVRYSATSVSGRLPPETVQHIVRNNYGRFRGCYANALRRSPGIRGRVVVRFVIDPVGRVTSVQDEGSTFPDPATTRCIMEAFSRLEFPFPAGGTVTVVYPLRLLPEGSDEDEATAATLPPVPSTKVELPDPEYPLLPRQVTEEAYVGEYSTLIGALRRQRWADAQGALQKLEGHTNQALIAALARGRFSEALNDASGARRAYGSLVDLFAHRPEVLRLAAAHWARLGDVRANELARDTLTRIIAAERGSSESQRQLAWTWVMRRDYRRALGLLIQILQRSSSDDRLDLRELLLQDVAMVARAAIAKTPAHQSEVFAQLRRVGVSLPAAGCVRFVLVPQQGDGLSLGLYPEMSKGRLSGTERWFGQYQVIHIADNERKSPYRIHVRNLPERFMASEPTAFGYVEIVDQDSRGAIVVDYRPFVFQSSHSEVDLGTYEDVAPARLAWGN